MFFKKAQKVYLEKPKIWASPSRRKTAFLIVESSTGVSTKRHKKIWKELF